MIESREVVARVLAEYFENIQPVDTVMEIMTFITPYWLVEIEVKVVIDEEAG